MIKTTVRALFTAAHDPDPKTNSPLATFLGLRTAPERTLARLRAKAAIESEIKIFFQARRRVFEQYRVPSTLTATHPAYDAVVKDIDALLDTEVSLPIEEIPFAEIGEGVLSPFELQALQFWIRLPELEPSK